jgi:transposase
MGDVSTIGLDIAKSVFQVHGVDVVGAVVIRKRVSRAKVLEYFGELLPCLVGIDPYRTVAGLMCWEADCRAFSATLF